MGFFSSVGSFLSDVASSARSAVSSAVETGKRWAGQAINWLADKAETFVGDVKEVWKKVKPYIARARPLLAEFANVAEKFGIPWVGPALRAFDKVLAALERWDQTDLAKRVDAAIRWTIDYARKLRDRFMQETPSETEAAEAKAATVHMKTLREARGHVRGEAAEGFDLASTITSFAVLTDEVAATLRDNKISDFDHYLRLRAAQKLLADTRNRLMRAQDLAALGADDIFVLETAHELLKPVPKLSDADIVRLDQIVIQRFGKKLIPFVFEEMIKAWGVNLASIEQELHSVTRVVAEKTVLQRRLTVSQRLGELDPEEAGMLAALGIELPGLIATKEEKSKLTNEQRNYVFAAEGFLQTLEKEEGEFAGQEYMLADSQAVGMILIDCAQGELSWDELTEDQRSLVIDFANIFEEESRKRASDLVELGA